MMLDSEWKEHPEHVRMWAIEQALKHGAPDTQVGARYLVAVLDGTWHPEPVQYDDIPQQPQSWKASRGL
jgi:hypothetical protein